MHTETKYDFDLFVIGGGSGGLSAAKQAANLGAKVGLADFVRPSPMGTKWGLGGTCVNAGCIPKKMMHFASLLGQAKHDQKGSGWEVDTLTRHNWSLMVASINTHVKRLNWDYKKSLSEEGVKYFNAFARFKDPHTLILTDKKGKQGIVTVDKVIVATGGRPTYLDIPNIRELAITSDDLFWRKKPPGKTLVIGAGYIAVECAGFIHGLGNEVDVLVRSTVLRQFDRDMARRVVRDMHQRGIRLMRGRLETVEKKDESIVTQCRIETNADLIDGGVLDSQTQKLETVKREYDTLLLAIGRTPETSKIGLDEIGVFKDTFGKVPVNRVYQSSIRNIHIIGDIRKGSPELTPVATKEGLFVANYLFGKDPVTAIDYNAIPTTIYSPLEYSVVGLSEEKAILHYGKQNVRVYHKSFKPLEWNFFESRPNDLCYTKVIVDKSDRETVLGIHYAGPNAGEVMQGFGLALTRKTTFAEIKHLGKYTTEIRVFWSNEQWASTRQMQSRSSRSKKQRQKNPNPNPNPNTSTTHVEANGLVIEESQSWFLNLVTKI